MHLKVDFTPEEYRAWLVAAEGDESDMYNSMGKDKGGPFQANRLHNSLSRFIHDELRAHHTSIASTSTTFLYGQPVVNLIIAGYGGGDGYGGSSAHLSVALPAWTAPIVARHDKNYGSRYGYVTAEAELTEATSVVPPTAEEVSDAFGGVLTPGEVREVFFGGPEANAAKTNIVSLPGATLAQITEAKNQRG